jgi:uncharacterized LabA/DUF88 family protein
VSKNVALFVDVANLYYSARGQDVDVDYVALLKTATKGRDLIRAYAYSGLDPENENQRKFIDFLNKNGYKVLTKDIRKFGDGRVKANLDIELVVDLFRLADRMDIAVIVSGDGDFAPAIKALQDKGVRCEVISFRPNTSSDLIAVADEFIDVMKIAGIGRGSKEAKAQRGMSAPEMPAKEVVPEFGFREASPGVAAAALAALREGRSEDNGRPAAGGRGRGRGRSSAAAPAAEVETAEASAERTDETATADDEPRKRRRRRGGRGRGRRGRGQGEATGGEESTGEPGDIGWVELDDLSQLAELEGIAADGDPEADREYTFEEADAATLAELGIDAEPAPADEAAPEAAEKKPARRRTTRKPASADAASTAADEAAQEAAEKKPARRRTTRKPASDDASTASAGEKPKRATRSRKAAAPAAANADAAADTAADTQAARKPARRRTTKAAQAATAEGSGDGAAEGDDAEGIWQRFRSARGRTRSS